MKSFGGWVFGILAAVFAAGLLITLILRSGTGPSARESRSPGREVVKRGETATITGFLRLEAGEWFVMTEEGEYELLLGNHEYRRRIGLRLRAGQEAAVDGFVYGRAVAVIRLGVGGREYLFRRDDGTPLWAGLAEGEGSGKEGGPVDYR